MEYVLNFIGVPELRFKHALRPFLVFGQHLHDHFIPHARNNYHPHILGHRALGLMSGLLVAVKIFTISLAALGPIVPAFSSAITPANIIALTNESRGGFNLPALRENSVLDKAAQDKANDMLVRGYFSHNTPDGKTPWSFIQAAGYSYLSAGENLAVNFTEAENVEAAWMNSPGHKANILNKTFSEIGIGIAQGEFQGHAAIFVVQMFGDPAGEPVALSDIPTKVQIPDVPVPAPALESEGKNPLPVVASNLGNQVKQKVLAQNSPAPIAAMPAEIKITAANFSLNQNMVNITAETQGPAVKVLAYFGQQAVMLSPKNDTQWEGDVPLSHLIKGSNTVNIQATGMQGQSAQFKLADFSGSTQENYNLTGTAPAVYASIMGKTFNVKSGEQRFYLIFIATLLSSLILAIGLKRHIQHLSLVANSSFVVILAVMLWAGG